MQFMCRKAAYAAAIPLVDSVWSACRTAPGPVHASRKAPGLVAPIGLNFNTLNCSKSVSQEAANTAAPANMPSLCPKWCCNSADVAADRQKREGSWTMSFSNCMACICTTI